MYRFLDNLRKKDKAKQESFTFFAAFTITLFIFFIWLVTLVYNFDDKSGKNTASPFSVFSNQIQTFFSGTQTYDAE